MKKYLTSAMVATLCMTSLAGCSSSDTPSTQESTTTQTTTQEVAQTETKVEETPVVEEVEEVIDLGGMEIIIGDWWSSAEPAAPTTAQEEATQEYREMIQEKYNFTMKQVSLGGWGEHQETFTVSTMAEDPAAQIFIMAQGFVAQPMANGLFYDLATLDNLDLSDEKWNPIVIEQMSKGDSVYGLASGKHEPRTGVFWNKRLFKEAGLDPDLPYDLQASGDWTWEKFEELCAVLTQDKDNDGINDTYALASFSVEYFTGAVLSNDAMWVDVDEAGKYFNATTSPEFLEAMQWAVSLIEKGYEMPTPEDANWD